MKLQNLCEYSNKEKTTISGPFSPLEGAKAFCKNHKIGLEGITRINWSSERTLQYKDEYSGMDSLLLKTSQGYFMILDLGVDINTIAHSSKENDEIDYMKISDKLIEPTKEEIEKVFTMVKNDQSLIIPKKYK